MALVLFDFLRQLAKLLGLFVTGLHLHLCELSRFLTRQERKQSLKFNCCVARVFGLCLHQTFKFPQRLIVIHTRA